MQDVDLLTVSEAAERLRISTSLTYELIRQERLPHLHLGRRVLVPADALARWILEASCELGRLELHRDGVQKSA